MAYQTTSQKATSQKAIGQNGKAAITILPFYLI